MLSPDFIVPPITGEGGGVKWSDIFNPRRAHPTRCNLKTDHQADSMSARDRRADNIINRGRRIYSSRRSEPGGLRCAPTSL